jgi:phospholipid/cholesterol/gamma-HCH transport system substrate-binding protein
MENSARLTGYAIALVILGTLLALVLFLKDGSVFRSREIQVSFPGIGTLMEDDPVRLHGVEVGRVASIKASEQGPIVTLEMYRKTPLPKDSRFVNYNYSLFGARMVVIVPGSSPEPLDASALQRGDYSNGVAETIHRVDELLRTVVEYKALSAQLEKGGQGEPSLSALLDQRIYPALDGFGRFTRSLEALQDKASGDMRKAAAFSDDVNAAARAVAARTDSMVDKTGRAVEQVAALTAQSEALLESLEKILAAAQDTTKTAGRVLMNRDLYDRTLALTHDLEELIATVKKKGLHDIIHFWRNVDVRMHRKKS